MRLRAMAAVVVAATVLATGGLAAAQVCGDANGSDTVTITDGVQALRAAAGLSSSCEDGCDVDGSGTITVSDGVNILRKAAGLAIVEVCDFTAQEASAVVGPSLSVFDALTKVPGVGGAGAEPAGVADCDNDGTVVTQPTPNAQVTTFTNCQIGGVILDGTVGRIILGQGVGLGFQGFTITNLAADESHALDGQLLVTSSTSPPGKRLGGTLTVTSSKRGTFTMEYQRILVIGDGSVRQGQLIYDLSDAQGKIAGIRITFDAGDELAVVVMLKNGQVKQFVLDRNTRKLTPAL